MTTKQIKSVILNNILNDKIKYKVRVKGEKKALHVYFDTSECIDEYKNKIAIELNILSEDVYMHVFHSVIAYAEMYARAKYGAKSQFPNIYEVFEMSGPFKSNMSKDIFKDIELL